MDGSCHGNRSPSLSTGSCGAGPRLAQAPAPNPPFPAAARWSDDPQAQRGLSSSTQTPRWAGGATRVRLPRTRPVPPAPLQKLTPTPSSKTRGCEGAGACFFNVVLAPLLQ